MCARHYFSPWDAVFNQTDKVLTLQGAPVRVRVGRESWTDARASGGVVIPVIRMGHRKKTGLGEKIMSLI